MAAMQRRDGTASRNVFAWHQQRGHLLPCARLRQEVFQQVVRKAAIVQCRLLMGSVEIGMRRKSEQGINRDVSGNLIPDQGSSRICSLENRSAIFWVKISQIPCYFPC